MSDSRVNRLREGQIMHCPDCGHGFPVRDPGAADEIEHLESRVAELEALLNEPTLADKLKNLGYKPHGKGIYIAALQEVSDE